MTPKIKRNIFMTTAIAEAILMLRTTFNNIDINALLR
jgi:hypothetical protein